MVAIACGRLLAAWRVGQEGRYAHARKRQRDPNKLSTKRNTLWALGPDPLPPRWP